MGVARLLAKGWVLVCLVAGGHALNAAIADGAGLAGIVPLLVDVALFAAMGLLFIGGYGVSAEHSFAAVRRLKPSHLLPGFNDQVFIAFVLLSFAVQVGVARFQPPDEVANWLERPIYFLVLGQRELVIGLSQCARDGPLDFGRIFASSVTWLLAIVFFASALSHLKLTAGIMRLERAKRPGGLAPLTLALVLGACAVLGIQLLVVGSLYKVLPCEAYDGITGALLIGLAPLMLSYLVVAALAALLATGKEQ